MAVELGGPTGSQAKPVPTEGGSDRGVRIASSSTLQPASAQPEYREVRIDVAAQSRNLGLIVHDGVAADVLNEAHARAAVQLKNLRVLEAQRRPLVRVFDVDLAQAALEQPQQVAQVVTTARRIEFDAQLVVGV